MKKFAIGCLGLILVLSIAGGIAGYIFVYRPAKKAITSTIDNVKQLEQISELNKQLKNQSSFTIPADKTLTEKQVDRYMAVQKIMRDNLETDFDTLEEKYKDIKEEPNVRDIIKLMSGYSDLIRIILDAKKTQVAALNSNGFSLGEYEWVKRQVFAAAGQTLTSIDLSKIASGDSNPTEVLLPTNIPEQNVELLKKYKDNLEDYMGLAFFGL